VRLAPCARHETDADSGAMSSRGVAASSGSPTGSSRRRADDEVAAIPIMQRLRAAASDGSSSGPLCAGAGEHRSQLGAWRRHTGSQGAVTRRTPRARRTTNQYGRCHADSKQEIRRRTAGKRLGSREDEKPSIGNG